MAALELLVAERRGAYVMIVIVYSSLFFSGVVASWLFTGVSPLLVLLGYWCTGFVGVLTHVVGHARLFDRWFRAHTVGHHIVAYPPSRFLSDNFEISTDPNWKFYLPAAYGPALGAAALGYGWPVPVVMAVTSMVAIWFADHIHTGMHLRGFWMERWALFRELRRLHVFHHKGDFHANFGVYDFLFDILLGTMRFK